MLFPFYYTRSGVLLKRTDRLICPKSDNIPSGILSSMQITGLFRHKDENILPKHPPYEPKIQHFALEEYTALTLSEAYISFFKAVFNIRITVSCYNTVQLAVLYSRFNFSAETDKFTGQYGVGNTVGKRNTCFAVLRSAHHIGSIYCTCTIIRTTKKSANRKTVY